MRSFDLLGADAPREETRGYYLILLVPQNASIQKTHRSNRYGVCYKCGDLHTNLRRHSSGCHRTPPDTIPPHSDGLGGEPSARNPATLSTPATESFNQSEQSSPSILLPRGIENVGPMLDALDGTTLARMSLSMGRVGSAGAPNALCSQPEACPTHFLSSSQCSTGIPSWRLP